MSALSRGEVLNEERHVTPARVRCFWADAGQPPDVLGARSRGLMSAGRFVHAVPLGSALPLLDR
jgi:hypothetical protein